MRIESLIVTGFKSFSEKTSFSLHPGITSIVGPNGCGKSNVVDAFKWVLGEQSAKSLRGDHMEDVIFSGSTTKKPKGMAEVTLVLSGINGGSPPEGDRVSVSRRLFRSGESEYSINHIPCRLKDIKNMFLDTGLELKAYSILEQNRIDEILNSKPKERRFLIEEVAGVMKYNLRKSEALQKLDSSRLNLQRLQDIINEVKRQISSIDRYAKRAERYKRIFEEIKEIEIKIALRDVIAMKEELEKIDGSGGMLKTRETELSVQIHAADAVIEEGKLGRLEKEKGLDEIQQRLAAVEREHMEEKARISLVRNECDNLRERSERLRIREEEISEAGGKYDELVRDLLTKNSDLVREIAAIEQTIGSKMKELALLEDDIEKMELGIEDRRMRILHSADDVSTMRNEISNLMATVENLEKKDRRDLEEIESLQGAISVLSSSLKETEEEYQRLGREVGQKRSEKEHSIRTIDEAEKELSSAEAALRKDREDLAAMDSRRESILDFFRKVTGDIRDNVKIICQVADILDTRPEHESAIDAVLGERLNASVMEDHQEIKKALQFIKAQKMSRSVFVPVTVRQVHEEPPWMPSPGDGLIGRADELIRAKDGFQNVAASLLRDVFIVDSLDTAFRLWQKAKDGSRSRYFVTLEGDILEPSGVVSGGTEKGVLTMKREIRTLEAAIDGKKSSVRSLEANVAGIRERIASLKSSLSALDETIVRLGRSHHEAEIRVSAMQEEQGREQKKAAFLAAERESAVSDKNAAAKTLEEKRKVLIEKETEKRSVELEARTTQDMVNEKRTLRETLRSECTEIMLKKTSLSEKAESQLREKERIEHERGQIEAKKEQMSAEALDITEKIRLKEEEHRARESSLNGFIERIESIRGEVSRSREILETQSADLALLERQQKVHIDELASVRRETATLDVRRTEISLGLAHLKENMKNIYAVDLDHIMGEQPREYQLLPEEEEKVAGLREKLREIGPVNLGTLEELEELRGRYEFLTRQQDDLLKSIDSLQETLAKINATTRTKLKDAFEALNDKFREVFSVLFGKGHAELVLTEENILEAGIEIVAQPPGKKLQNLMLLSGGEKALTALSLLFAGFMIKPTPLCLLDEVDAPLDESNTERFTVLLSEISRNIQFIVITHNKRTMEVADYLYGITMEEPGVSKVVSIHMAEAL